MNFQDQVDSPQIEFDRSRELQANVNEVAKGSVPFVGQWNRLISTTNWEKGLLINQWRAHLHKEGFSVRHFSDEVWSRIVGGITSQHVGRLRRTSERFEAVQKTYAGLYWSHFYAALDWPDAEMWLEGAVQSSWSVSEMRMRRWETLGQPESMRPNDSEIVSAEPHEETAELASRDLPMEAARDRNFESEPLAEGPDFGDDPQRADGLDGSAKDWMSSEPEDGAPPVRLFENFTNLPDDLSEATTSFKLAIVRHKSAHWNEISLDRVLELLEALKQLANSK